MKLRACFLALVATLAAVSARAQTQASPARPFSRAEAMAIIADARKIVTPNGVERVEKVRIGGIDLWISTRGADRRNPVLIVLHGGPGYVDMPMSWWFGPGVGGVLHRRLLGPARRRKDIPTQRSREDRANPDAGAHGF
jgi:proline iminopeptidase